MLLIFQLFAFQAGEIKISWNLVERHHRKQNPVYGWSHVL